MKSTMEIGDLAEIGRIVATPGWEILKRRFHEQWYGENNLGRVSGDGFENGKLVGRVEAFAEVTRYLSDVEHAAAQAMEREGNV